MAVEHPAEHPAWGLHSPSLPRGTGRDDMGGAVAHLSGCRGTAGRRGGAAGCQGVTQPGWHAVLAGLRACRY